MPDSQTPSPVAMPGHPTPSPPESAADSFGEALHVAASGHAAVEQIIAILDREWESAAKPGFLDALRTTAGWIRDRLLPRLQALEEISRRRVEEDGTG
jgi:hypothetical protein